VSVFRDLETGKAGARIQNSEVKVSGQASQSRRFSSLHDIKKVER